MSRFVHLKDAKTESIDIAKQWLRYACCDCGMVHDIIFDIDGDILSYVFTQVPRASAQLRRHRFGNLHRTVGQWWMGRVKK